MLPYIDIYRYKVASYGFIIFLGLIIGICFSLFYFSRFYNIKKEDIFYAITYSIIGVGVGAKFFYIMINISLLIENPYRLMNMMSGGFVFYGGLIGGILGTFIYSKQFHISFDELLLILIPSVPIVHSVGRIGCFCAGCCYGMEYHGVGAIQFRQSITGVNNIDLFPIQIVESFLNLIIFIIILKTYKKYIYTYKSIGIYFILYGLVRFGLEFFRGDLERGIFLYLSTSQWISIFIFIVGVNLFLNHHKYHYVSMS